MTTRQRAIEAMARSQRDERDKDDPIEDWEVTLAEAALDAALGVMMEPQALRNYGWLPGHYFITCRDCAPQAPGTFGPIGAKLSNRCQSHATLTMLNEMKGNSSE